MNNLLSYCGLIDAKIGASDKDLPINGVENSNLFLTKQREVLIKFEITTSKENGVM